MVNVKGFSLGYLSKTAMFAKYLSDLCSKQFYLVIGQIGDNHESKLSWSGWSNALDITSAEPYLTNYKISEFSHSGPGKIFSKTPIPDFENGYGYKCLLNSYVAVGNLSLEHDQLIAAVILYQHLYQKLQLHHVGIACNCKLFESCAQNSNGYLKNTSNLFRFYIPKDNSVFGKSYIEYFYCPEEYTDNEYHLDFVVDDIKNFLDFLSEVTGVTPEYWPDTDENSPKGGIFITDSENSTLGVMCRQSFWDLKDI